MHTNADQAKDPMSQFGPRGLLPVVHQQVVRIPVPKEVGENVQPLDRPSLSRRRNSTRCRWLSMDLTVSDWGWHQGAPARAVVAGDKGRSHYFTPIQM